MKSLDRGGRRHGGAAAGMTLIELMLSLAIMATFLAAIGILLVSSHNAFLETMATTATEESADRALDRIIWELRFADRDSVSLSQTSDAPSISYCKLQGWSSGAPVLGPVQTIALGSGKVLLDGVPIAAGVKSLTFNRAGDVIRVAVQVEGTARVSGATRAISRRMETKVLL